MPGFEMGNTATVKVGLTVSQVSIWSDLVGSWLLAGDTGLLQSCSKLL